MLNGKHLIAGEWVGSTETFPNTPVNGESDHFARGTPEHVDMAVEQAVEAFDSYGTSDIATRAHFLRVIADEIDTRGNMITEIGTRETGLPSARLEGERGRTCGQLRLFADHIEAGDWLDRRHDEALPDRAPLPRPDLRMIQRPIGPVAVFGASNFPLAFSTAGGDTASALAAGCPVIVKGHSAHPGVADLVAQAIHAAVLACGIHPGVFSQIQGGNRDMGTALVKHPDIRAIGFTGSLTGGRALFNLCAARPEPIPFFGELGSVNPMFVLPHAAAARGEEIGEGWAGSLLMGAGQFCTNPGITVVVGPAEDFINAAKQALTGTPEQIMLTDSIATAYHEGRDRLAERATVLEKDCSSGRGAKATLLQVDASTFMKDEVFAEEVFGPLGLIVTAADEAEMLAVASHFRGQLTATMHLDDGDHPLAKNLLPILERMAGRVLANGFPTGVEVSDAMVHGGPYPASTNFGATSVGTLAIRRFLRPVCYQNIPKSLLPKAFKS